MLKTKDLRPEEIALGFLVNTLTSRKKSITKSCLAQYALYPYLAAAVKNGVLQEVLDPATGIKCYKATADFLQQFSQMRAAQLAAATKKKQPEEKPRDPADYNYSRRAERYAEPRDPQGHS